MSAKKRPSYTLDDGRQALAGLAPPEMMRDLDRRGLSLPGYAVLQSAVTTEEIRADVRQLLEPPPEGAGRMEQLLEALEAIVARLDRVEAKLDRLAARGASTTSAPPGHSPQPRPRPTSGSTG